MYLYMLQKQLHYWLDQWLKIEGMHYWLDQWLNKH